MVEGSIKGRRRLKLADMVTVEGSIKGRRKQELNILVSISILQNCNHTSTSTFFFKDTP